MPDEAEKTAKIESLVLEQLRPIRGELGGLRDDVREIKGRMASIETRMTSLERLGGSRA